MVRFCCRCNSQLIWNASVDGVFDHKFADQLRPGGQKTFPFRRVHERIGTVGIFLTAAHLVQCIIVAEVVADQNLHRLVNQPVHGIEKLLTAFGGKAIVGQTHTPH